MSKVNVFGYNVLTSAYNQLIEKKSYTPIRVTYKMVKPRLFYIFDYINARLISSGENFDIYRYKELDMLLITGDEETFKQYIKEKEYAFISPTNGKYALFYKDTIKNILGYPLKNTEYQSIIKSIVNTVKESNINIVTSIYYNILHYVQKNFLNILDAQLFDKDSLSEHDAYIIDTDVDEDVLEHYDKTKILSFYFNLTRAIKSMYSSCYIYKNLYKGKKSIAVQVSTKYYVLIPVLVSIDNISIDILSFIDMINSL